MSARSDETDAASHAVLPRPRDMAAETLDAASPELAARIETLWNSQASADDRRQALTELQALVPAIPADGPHASLRQRLLRRLALLSAALDAATVSSLQAPATDYTAQLQSATAQLAAVLNTTPNGRLWIDYLALGGLTQPADDGTSERISAFITRVSGIDQMSPEQQGFLLSSEVQDLKASAESALAYRQTFASDDEAR
ncbi:MAG: hypothetical protein ACK58J_27355 [Planctomyces sp.]